MRDVPHEKALLMPGENDYPDASFTCDTVDYYDNYYHEI